MVTTDWTRNREELDQTTRANAKSPARLTTPLEGKDGEKDEQMYGESFKPGSHRDSSRRRTRYLRRGQEGEEDVGGWRIPASWRTFLERFETRRPSSGKRNRQKKRARKANASSGRSFDHLGNEMPGNWKSLNAPVCEDAYGNRRCSPSSPPRSRFRFPVSSRLLNAGEFRARVIVILNHANLNSQLQNQTFRIHYNLGKLNAWCQRYENVACQ